MSGRLYDRRLICCVLPKGQGPALLKALHEEKGIHTGNLTHGRGVGMADAVLGHGSVEAEVLTVIVSLAEADDIFHFIHERAGIAERRGAFIYQHRLGPVTQYKLPEVSEESEAGALGAISRIAKTLHVKEDV